MTCISLPIISGMCGTVMSAVWGAGREAAVSDGVGDTIPFKVVNIHAGRFCGSLDMGFVYIMYTRTTRSCLETKLREDVLCRWS
jgi:hypothetical protein